MEGAVLDRKGRSDAAEPFNWVTRAKLQSLMNEQYHRCKVAVDQHLDAYYGERQGSVFARAGVTARSSVDLFESQAVKLVGMLVDSARPLSRHARAFQMITEMTNGFITYIDLVVGRIGPRIDLEMRNLPKSEHRPVGAGELWAESRARVLEGLDRYRSEFGLPEKAPPALERPLLPDLEIEPVVHELETVPECEEALAAEPGNDPWEVAEEPVLLEAEPSPPAPMSRHWQDMWTDIAVQLCTGKLQPKTQADLGVAMSNWFTAQGIEDFEAEVEECGRRFWRKFAASLRVTSSLDQSAIDRAMEVGESTLDRLAWQSGSLRSAGIANGGSAIFRNGELGDGAAIASYEHGGSAAYEQVQAAPASSAMRCQVSWSMKPDSSLTAPGFEIL